MKPYFVKTPNFIPKLFSSQIWSFSSKQKSIYLTFDDGPTPKITDWILNTLQQYNAQATFFCIGKNIEEYPPIFNKILQKGHSIGNHTYSHLNGWKISNKDYIENILKAERLMNAECRVQNKTLNSKLFRPPYGKIKPSQTKSLQKLGYNIIMWSVLSADFDNEISANKCFDNVVNNTENGTIIVFHDSVKAYNKLKIVLPKVLDYFSKKRYDFRKIK